MEKKEQTQKQSEHTVGKRRGSRFLQRTMAFGFCGAVLLLVLISLIMPDRSFSEEENRVLSKAAEIRRHRSDEQRVYGGAGILYIRSVHFS